VIVIYDDKQNITKQRDAEACDVSELGENYR
jgi:hypothetical protein